MSSPIDNTFALPAAALKLHARRTQLLSENIANADTPNYKARDIDFRAAMRHFETGSAGTLQTTNSRHIEPNGAGVENPTVKYRVPANPSLDGNTVEMEREQSRFAQNTVEYRAALTFLGNRIQGLIGAIKGQ